MNERIKLLRKQLGLSQTEFGAKIGVKQTSVAGYEIGARVPLDAVVNSICREFHVSESWLRTGEGEMFVKQSRDAEIAEFIGGLLQGEATFKRRLVSVLARLDEDQWALLEKMAKSLAEETKKADP